MSREFNSVSPDEQPENNFFEALSENLGNLDDTPIDEIFQNMDADKLAQMEAELDALGPEAFAGWEEDDDDDPTPAVNKDDIWDFREKFDGPAREYNENERDMSLGSFTSAKRWNFMVNSDHVRTGVIGERLLDLSYQISDDSEFRTRISEKPNDDRTPIISITHWESGVGKESSTYVVDKNAGLVRRYDEPFNPDKQELLSRLQNFISGKEDLSQEEIENTVNGVLDGFYHRMEVREDEERLGVNGRPVSWAEIMRIRGIIDQSAPLNPRAEK